MLEMVGVESVTRALVSVKFGTLVEKIAEPLREAERQVVEMVPLVVCARVRVTLVPSARTMQRRRTLSLRLELLTCVKVLVPGAMELVTIAATTTLPINQEGGRHRLIRKGQFVFGIWLENVRRRIPSAALCIRLLWLTRIALTG